MRSNFETALKAILKVEGNFVNHPADPGGMTNLGVTKKVWEEWCGQSVDEAEIRALSPEKVTPLYKIKFWDMIQGNKLPHGVDLCVFDCAVNSGVRRASKLLQRAVGVEEDGLIGHITLTACAAVDADFIIQRFSEERLAFLQSLPTFSTFGKGWTRRVAQMRDEAQAIA